jgi:hypothetical protein
MYELKKIGKVFTSKFVGTGPSSYKKRIYRAAVSQRLRNTELYRLQGLGESRAAGSKGEAEISRPPKGLPYVV